MQCGGIDSELDALEDWDLWLRCILRVPADKTDYAAREVSFAEYRAAMQPRLMKYCAQAGIPMRNTKNAALKAPQTGKEACQEQDTAAARHLAASAQPLTGKKRTKLFEPPAPDFATADAAAALNRFTFAARTCVFWRALSRLAAHGHTQ